MIGMKILNWIFRKRKSSFKIKIKNTLKKIINGSKKVDLGLGR